MSVTEVSAPSKQSPSCQPLADIGELAVLERQKTIALIQKQMEELAGQGKLPLAPRPSDIVPGEGALQAKIMLIGEAPGYHETVQRRPFVGLSGQLLRKTLVAAGFPPELVFISNIVKARPPENRDPTPEEITAYQPFLDDEVRLLQPKLIVTLGRFSMAKFLPEVKISQVHGRLHKVRWQGKTVFVLPMYHPAAALRSTQMKTSFQADFAKLAPILSWVEEQQATTIFSEVVKAELLEPEKT